EEDHEAPADRRAEAQARDRATHGATCRAASAAARLGAELLQAGAEVLRDFRRYAYPSLSSLDLIARPVGFLSPREPLLLTSPACGGGPGAKRAGRGNFAPSVDRTLTPPPTRPRKRERERAECVARVERIASDSLFKQPATANAAHSRRCRFLKI